MPLVLDDIGRRRRASRAGQAGAVTALAGPVFARAVFDLPAESDLYLSTAGLGKGIAWINGFCVGRYWSRGPQRTLYVPGPVTRRTGNELIILELHSAASPVGGVRIRSRSRAYRTLNRDGRSWHGHAWDCEAGYPSE